MKAPGLQPVSPRLVEFAERLADAARPIVKRHFRRDLAVEQKSDSTPVTAADRQVEGGIRRLIRSEYPDHGIIGEEFDTEGDNAEYVWVIDPIDGTKAFICGMPTFGTLIALARGGDPVLGVMDQPIIGERWVGARGSPARFNGRVVHTRRCASMAEARLCLTSPDHFRGPDEAPLARLRQKVKVVRWGASCYGYGLLAIGCIDLVLDTGLDPYDYMAQVPIVQQAGGLMTDWEGRELSLQLGASRVLAAGDPALHAEVVALIRAELS